jgi:hypothetical protein
MSGLGGFQCRSVHMRKMSPSPGSDPRTVQPVASPYTDWAIPVPQAPPKRREYLVVNMQSYPGRIQYAPALLQSASNVNYCQGQTASVDTFVVVSIASCWKTTQYFAKWICSCPEVTGLEGTTLWWSVLYGTSTGILGSNLTRGTNMPILLCGLCCRLGSC